MKKKLNTLISYHTESTSSGSDTDNDDLSDENRVLTALYHKIGMSLPDPDYQVCSHTNLG